MSRENQIFYTGKRGGEYKTSLVQQTPRHLSSHEKLRKNSFKQRWKIFSTRKFHSLAVDNKV